MGDSLEAFRTSDLDVIKYVIANETIISEISSDGKLPASMEIDPVRNCFLVIAVKNEIIGLYIFHPVNSATVEIHANILPEYRKEFADQSLAVALEWLEKELPEAYVKIVANIPDVFPNVYHFALKHGFVEEGRLTQAYRKDGALCDIHILGMQRSEIARAQ